MIFCRMIFLFMLVFVFFFFCDYFWFVILCHTTHSKQYRTWSVCTFRKILIFWRKIFPIVVFSLCRRKNYFFLLCIKMFDILSCAIIFLWYFVVWYFFCDILVCDILIVIFCRTTYLNNLQLFKVFIIFYWYTTVMIQIKNKSSKSINNWLF